jgi:flagellar motor switch protein FliM
MSIISDWLGRACKSAVKQWSKQWPFAPEVGLGDIRTVLPTELVKSIPETSLGCGLDVWGNSVSPAFLTFDRPLLLALLSGLLGEPVSALPEDRELTAIERSMIDLLIDQIMTPIRNSWPGENGPKLRVTATGAPRTTCRLSPTEPAIVAALAINAPFGDGTFRLVLPTKGWSVPTIQSPEKSVPNSFPREEIESAVRELGVDFSVTLGHARLALKELANLKRGDVVLLEQRVTEPLRAYVGGKERFQVWPGAVGPSQAVRIHSASQPGKT